MAYFNLEGLVFVVLIQVQMPLRHIAVRPPNLVLWFSSLIPTFCHNFQDSVFIIIGCN